VVKNEREEKQIIITYELKIDLIQISNDKVRVTEIHIKKYPLSLSERQVVPQHNRNQYDFQTDIYNWLSFHA